MKFGSITTRIKRLAQKYSEFDEKQLKDLALNLGFASRQSDNISPLIERAFALVQVAAKRKLNMTHYDVQLLGGYAMLSLIHI